MVDNKKDYKNYQSVTSFDWSDVKPLPQYDGKETILRINYTHEYRSLMDLFRAVIKSNEISERVFELTEYVVRNACGTYTAWYIRRICLEKLQKDLQQEILFVNELMPRNEKNYQIWEHRRYIMDKLPDLSVKKELDFLNSILSTDNKNYHVWSYRKELVIKHNLYESEAKETEELIEEDIRNNSAWNHRFFLMSQKLVNKKEDLSKELKYVFSRIEIVPFNESPWNYLNGWFPFYNFKCLRAENNQSEKKDSIEGPKYDYSDFPEVESFCDMLISKEEENSVVYALSTLINIYLLRGELTGLKKALSITERLATIDSIRKNYWFWTKKNIQEDFKSVPD